MLLMQMTHPSIQLVYHFPIHTVSAQCSHIANANLIIIIVRPKLGTRRKLKFDAQADKLCRKTKRKIVHHLYSRPFDGSVV